MTNESLCDEIEFIEQCLADLTQQLYDIRKQLEEVNNGK